MAYGSPQRKGEPEAIVRGHSYLTFAFKRSAIFFFNS